MEGPTLPQPQLQVSASWLLTRRRRTGHLGLTSPTLCYALKHFIGSVSTGEGWAVLSGDLRMFPHLQNGDFNTSPAFQPCPCLIKYALKVDYETRHVVSIVPFQELCGGFLSPPGCRTSCQFTPRSPFALYTLPRAFHLLPP